MASSNTIGNRDVSARTESYLYRTPMELRASDSGISRVLVIGSCLIAALPEIIRSELPNAACDYMPFNNMQQLPEVPPASQESYNFQIVQIPMRSIVPDGSYLRLSKQSEEQYRGLLEDTKERLRLIVDGLLFYNEKYGMLTFITNFLVPQQNPLGRLLPRYEARNLTYFIEEINRFLHELIGLRSNCHVIDVDQIAASLGKKYIQDDCLWPLNHASAVSDVDFELDQSRLEAVTRVSKIYDIKVYDFARSIVYEVDAMYRTLKKIDAVKLVILDLDDTVWRGVLAEDGRQPVEGWPLGLAEALLFLKSRGIILAIASKNEETYIRRVFNSVFGEARLSLADFAIVKINWQPKAENIREIISEVNVLPTSVVFIDDNPVERAAVEAAIPGLRALRCELYSIRRALLWSPEAQVPLITRESARRTEMVAAQVERDLQRKQMTREEFLLSLNVKVTSFEIRDTSDERFQRSSELVNKSNQFNTTGRRWSLQDWTAAFAAGSRIFAFEVVDRFTDYGLVVVAVLSGSIIEQFVMSCRVIGLGIEQTALAGLDARLIGEGEPFIFGKFLTSGANNLCKDLFENAGFVYEGELWRRSTEPQLLVPSHVGFRDVGVALNRAGCIA